MGRTDIAKIQVPQPFFNRTGLGTISDNRWEMSTNPRVHNLAYQVAASGEMVPLVSTVPNATYHLDFAGLAIRCTSANDSMIRKLTAEDGRYKASRFKLIDFASWVPGRDVVTSRNEITLLKTISHWTRDPAMRLAFSS